MSLLCKAIADCVNSRSNIARSIYKQLLQQKQPERKQDGYNDAVLCLVGSTSRYNNYNTTTQAGETQFLDFSRRQRFGNQRFPGTKVPIVWYESLIGGFGLKMVQDGLVTCSCSRYSEKVVSIATYGILGK